MPQPLLSIITSTYNSMKYFRETAESVFRLDLDYEWIIFDNFSNDGTRPYIRKIAQNHNNLSYFFNKRNPGGPFSNFSKGVQKASGKYLLFLDSDDTIPSSTGVKAGIKFLEQNPKIHIAISKVAFMDEFGSVYKIKRIPWVRYNSVVPGKLLFWIVFFWPIYPLRFGAVLVRKSLFEKTGNIFDIALILGASQHTSFALIDHVGLHYRILWSSLSSSRRSLRKDNYWARLASNFLSNDKYWGLKYPIACYKFILELTKILFTKFLTR